MARAPELSAGQDLDGHAAGVAPHRCPRRVGRQASPAGVEDRDQAHGRGALPSVALDGHAVRELSAGQDLDGHVAGTAPHRRPRCMGRHASASPHRRSGSGPRPRRATQHCPRRARSTRACELRNRFQNLEKRPGRRHHASTIWKGAKDDASRAARGRAQTTRPKCLSCIGLCPPGSPPRARGSLRPRPIGALFPAGARVPHIVRPSAPAPRCP
jgi:hypothetical protein